VTEISREEFGAMICEALKEHDLHAVLTGGSCVSIWTDNRYESQDLDFIVMELATNRQIARALQAIGMQQSTKNPRYFHHPDYPLDVEFPSGPLAAGDEALDPARAEERVTPRGTLRLLSPTDCVKDRLANFVVWSDEQCLDQAVDVASSHPVKMAEIHRWLDREGRGDFIAQFDALIEACRRNRREDE
jgi:hypothetical protein